jgi:hypothetical protein
MLVVYDKEAWFEFADLIVLLVFKGAYLALGVKPTYRANHLIGSHMLSFTLHTDRNWEPI